MRPSVIKKKLKAGKPSLLTQLHLTDASIFEMVSVMGFDGIWMDLEHHGYSLETAGHLIRATRVGSADILARAAKGEYMRMGRLLEMGVQGIMYPRCSNASEAEEVVRWTKFAPLGQRGFDGAGADAFYTGIPMDEYVKDANEETFTVIQMEDPKAVEYAEAIAAVQGVDVIMLGSADFSVHQGPDSPVPQVSMQRKRTAACSSRRPQTRCVRSTACFYRSAYFQMHDSTLFCHFGSGSSRAPVHRTRQAVSGLPPSTV